MLIVGYSHNVHAKRNYEQLLPQQRFIVPTQENGASSWLSVYFLSKNMVSICTKVNLEMHFVCDMDGH